MAFALKRKFIRCPNCNYEGKAKIVGNSAVSIVIFISILLLSFIFWPLFIVSFIMFIAMVVKPAAQICPKCKWQNPIPINKSKEFQFDETGKLKTF